MLPEFYEMSVHTGETLKIGLRISPRTTRYSLRLTQAGFVLTVPPYADPVQTEKFLQECRGWILRTLEKKRLADARKPAKVLPEQIFLPFTGETFDVRKIPADVCWCAAKTVENTVELTGRQDFETASAALRDWLIRKAGTALLPYAGDLAGRYGFAVAGFRTGIQKTTWGTCSSKRIITLNALLLFMTRQTVEYVIFHEFCHLQEMNHSVRFWRLLEQYYPGAKAMRLPLKNAIRNLPAWTSP